MSKRIFLFEGILQIFIAIGAVGGGLILILDPSGQDMGFSIDLLSNSPFTNYLIPGLFLFAVNGFGNFYCAFLSFRKHRYAGYAGILFGAVMMAWILVQVAIIGWGSWLQPLFLFLGALELVVGLLLRKDLARGAE